MITLDFMPLALFGHFHPLSKYNLHTVEKVSGVFEKTFSNIFVKASLSKYHTCPEIFLHSTVLHNALTHTSKIQHKSYKLKGHKI